MKTLALIATLLTAAALAGCGDDDDSSDAPPGGTTTPAFIGDVSDSDEPQLVSGNLLVQGGEARLCSALAESFPPQCGGPSLLVDGLDLDTVADLTTQGDVSWTDRPIVLEGVVDGDTLTVSDHGR
jgi:hypothetical protein